MRRRLILASVGLTALALVLSGLLTLLLVRRSARDQTERDLVHQAIAVADRAGTADTFQVLVRVSESLGLGELGRVTFNPDGTMVGAAPAGLSRSDLRPDLLADGYAVSGSAGSVIYAAAPVRGVISDEADRSMTAIVITKEAGTEPRRAGAWFVVSGVLSLAVAALVAGALGRRFTAPLLAAQHATGRIADGELDARVGPVRADAELVQLTTSIDAMADALERSRGLERQFLLSVSHDLRTPLTSITGFAEALADGVADDPVAAARVIGTEARRLERLVGDLLELAKLDARGFSLSRQQVDAAAVVTDGVAAFAPAAVALGIELHTDVTAPLPAVTDADRLGQIVANLVENALNHARSRVGVSAGAHGNQVVLSVDDDGPGIAVAEREQVFERFYRGDRRTARQMGSGLGLAIVAELATALGGSAHAEEAPGGGTRIVVTVSSSTSSSTADASSKSS